ncbi:MULTISPECIES: hypothetical protein [Cyanophyceae]|uniref:hypothetical protein n=1 Tax=Cyanophyceae TaxID=3028117 RepID=UPI001685C08A|nr:hypothetical protein [Trichocoleus sp. FACHB-69]MBD1931264.1 hypothetical protein [Trichocoleus sp. FACHB-69]
MQFVGLLFEKAATDERRYRRLDILLRSLTSFDAGAGDRSFMTNTPYRRFQIHSENFK